MKNKVLIIAILSCLILGACKAKDEIVKASVVNKDGVSLGMTFNNTKRTAVFVLNEDKIEMNADTAASGIKYSNRNYEFVEWHGEIIPKSQWFSIKLRIS